MTLRKLRNVKQALAIGFEYKSESEISGFPEIDNQTKGKLLLERDGQEIVVPYVATYRFGAPRGKRKGERFV